MHGFSGPVGRDDDGPDDVQASGVDRVMADHHRTMRQMLDVQERLMLAYLEGGERMPRPFSTPRPAPASRLPLSRPASPQPAPSARPVERSAAPVLATPVASAPPPPAAKPLAPLVPPQAPAPSPAALLSDPKALLLRIASERTGYPEDMLGLDLDMEADLGIDSIKRVEILASFRKAQPVAVSDLLVPRMEQIAKAKTLQEVLDRVGAALPEAQGTLRPFDHSGEGHGATLSRYVMRPATEDLPAGGPLSVPRGVYLIVPDTDGLAAELTRLLERDGAEVRHVPQDLTASDAALETWLGAVRAAGPIRGLISLASAMPPEAGSRDTAAWQAGMERCVKSLFVLLRSMAPDLMGGGIVAVASAMGGLFGRDALRRPDHAEAFAGAGGGVGLIKSLAMEWPACLCKAVDLDPGESHARHAAHIHAEIATRAGRREVGYPNGSRTIFRTERAALRADAPALDQPGPDWVVLAVGGARGITAETLRPFAASGARCVVVGRSALPGLEEAETLPLADASALRGHFLAEAAAARTRPTPAKIEARIKAVLRDRETRDNMADFAALGARIDYRTCDVKAEAEVSALLDSVYADYGRIDAVLFGAGLIEDSLIVDKSRESLSRVFDTKVDGAFFFARHLRPQTLKFLALFSSVAGRYGNRGQTDYAAANEVLNRFAWHLQARFGRHVKVTSVNWGAWARTTNGPGMLTAETARQFRERGLRLIEPLEGRDFLWNELLHGPRDEVEVVAGEHPWDEQEAEAARPRPQDTATEQVAA